MNSYEIGSRGFGQTAQHPDDRTSCKHKAPTISAMNSRLLGCSVWGEWSIESGKPVGLGRISYLATGRTSLPWALHA
jgi:hypothetical protein